MLIIYTRPQWRNSALIIGGGGGGGGRHSGEVPTILEGYKLLYPTILSLGGGYPPVPPGIAPMLDQ